MKEEKRVSDFNCFPIPLGPQQENDYAPFFLGQITRQKNKNVVCVTFTSGLERAKKRTLAAPQGVIIKQWVVGRERKNGRPPRFFGVNEREILEYPVQVIPWNYISESKRKKSAAEFFREFPVPTKVTSSFPLIGTSEGKNGHVIIYDSEREVFLKGFSHVGGGKIECSDVKSLPSEKFIDDVEQYNQATPMTSDTGQRFLLLVPKQKNQHEERGAHSVLDVGSWEELDVAANANSKRELKKLPSGSSVSEEEFFNRFQKFSYDCGFKYSPRDLMRFHTCVKCGFFTLLGGDPGTGKSSLALLYAKALAGSSYKDKHSLLRIDVNPGWMEPADLMGYYSTTAKCFCESGVGLVTFLKEAQEKYRQRIICLEEMNLAYVEHYFSDFIQQMSRVDGDRSITIKSDSGEETIVLGNNLRFIGTVNFDETTRELSPRFYDRCNYIELSIKDEFSNERKMIFPRSVTQINVPKFLEEGCSGSEVGAEDFNKWCVVSSGKEIDKEILTKLDEVYPILHSLHIAPSPRKVCDIYKYILTRPTFDGDEKQNEKILDEVIAQRILPVYRRPDDRQENDQRKLWRFLDDNKLILSKNLFARILRTETPYPDES